jgi:Xaa-Pro aminopeptidase
MRSNTIFRRLESVQKKLVEAKLDAVLIEEPLDLYYLTQLQLSTGKLLITTEGFHLFVDGRYLQAAQESKALEVSLDSSGKLLSFLQEKNIHALGFDERHTSYERFLQLEAMHIKLISWNCFLKRLRAIKDEEELEKMRKSAALLWKGLEFILSKLHVGVKEKELSKAFEIFCLEQGADGLSFEPIIAFGANSAMPHYRSQATPLKEGDLVLIDIGLVLNRYHSDMTRVFFYKQENNELKRFYQIAQQAQKAALQLCRPGAIVKELDIAARHVMKEEGVEDLFLHSLGHGIGLETHEFPRLKCTSEDKDVVLESGMVITIEPGLYLPGLGGVRYEDTIIITPSGHENLYP